MPRFEGKKGKPGFGERGQVKNPLRDQLKLISKHPGTSSLLEKFTTSHFAREIAGKPEWTRFDKLAAKDMVERVTSELHGRLGLFNVKGVSLVGDVSREILNKSEVKRVGELSSKNPEDWTLKDLNDAAELHVKITGGLHRELRKLREYRPEILSGRVARYLKENPNLVEHPNFWTRKDLEAAPGLYMLVKSLKKEKR